MCEPTVVFRALAIDSVVLASYYMVDRLFRGIWESLGASSAFVLMHILPLQCACFAPLVFKDGHQEKVSGKK